MSNELKIRLEQHAMWLMDKGFNSPKLSKTPGYSYWVCKNGNIASAITPSLSLRKTPKILKQRVATNGYLIFCYKRKNYLAHRVIAEEFIGKIKNKVVHHRNSNKKDNRVVNLEITSSSKNNREGFKTRKKLNKKIITEMIRYYRSEAK